MSALATGAAAYQTLSALRQALTELNYGDSAAEIANGFMERAQPVITAAARSALVDSTIYLEEDLKDDPKLALNIMSTVQQLYGGYVITALGMESMIAGCRVRDLLRRVATEDFMMDTELLAAGRELLLGGHVSVEAAGATGGSSKVLDLEGSGRFSAGKVFEVSFQLENGKKISTDIIVQLFPQWLDTKVTEQLVTLNYSESLRQRWTKYSTGEYTFWTDFMFGLQEMRGLDSALRKDKSGTLVEAMKKRQNALIKRLLSFALPKMQTRNAATTVLAITKPSFDRACSNAGIDLRIASHRDRFFTQSMMLMVVVVDIDHSMVDIFTNGLKNYGSYPFVSLEKVGGKDAAMDMKSLLAVLSQGNAARF